MSYRRSWFSNLERNNIISYKDQVGEIASYPPRIHCHEAKMHRYHIVLARLLFSLICLSLLATLSTASPIVQPPGAFFPISQSPSLQNKWNSPSRGRTDLPLPGVRLDLLEKRVPPGTLFNDPGPRMMRMFRFTKVGLLTPVVVAAKALKDFYFSIALKAAGEWQATPMSDSLVIREGQLQLSIFCIGDTIPWSFVKEMGMRLYECANRGFTDLFDAIYVNDAGNIAVTMSMRIMDDSSSSDGSMPDYREGSVPSVTFP